MTSKFSWHQIRASSYEDAKSKFRKKYPDIKIIKCSKFYLSGKKGKKRKRYVNIYFEKPTLFKKFIYYIKTIYDSPRGKSHDFFFEGKLEWIKDSEPSIFDIEDKIKQLVRSGNFKTNTSIKDFIDNFDLDEMEIKQKLIEILDLNEMEIGQDSSEQETTKTEESATLEVTIYGYHI